MTCPRCRTAIRVTRSPHGGVVKDCDPGCAVQKNRARTRERWRAQHAAGRAKTARAVVGEERAVEVPGAVALVAPAVDPRTCARCGAGGLRTERADFGVTRRRVVYVCGHDAWEPLAEWRPRAIEAVTRPCTGCGEDFTPDATCRRRCPRCHTCPCGADRDGRTHALADCPKAAVGVA